MAAAGAEARRRFAGVEARHPDEGGGGKCFLATKITKGIGKDRQQRIDANDNVFTQETI